MKKKLFFQLNTARSLLVIINIPIIIVGLITVVVLFKFASNEISELNTNSTTYATQISETSHNEEAWLAYVDTGQMISFNKAFELKALNQ